MKALLLIDIQPDFMPGGHLPVPEGDAILPLVNDLQSKFDLVVATQDWHPPGHRSFASSHPGRNVFEQIELHGHAQVLWPDHCVQGTAGAALHPQLDTNRIEAIFRKGTNPELDSYSGFFDNGHQRSTGLADYLRGRGVTEVYLAGLAADYCVYFSAKDALQESFAAYVVEDAIRAIDAQGYAGARTDVQHRGGQFVHSSALF